MKKIFHKVILILGLFCFVTTVILMMIAVQFNNPKYQLTGVFTFLLMWIFSVLDNMLYKSED